jgi:hypothetical protein
MLESDEARSDINKPPRKRLIASVRTKVLGRGFFTPVTLKRSE